MCKYGFSSREEGVEDEKSCHLRDCWVVFAQVFSALLRIASHPRKQSRGKDGGNEGESEEGGGGADRCCRPCRFDASDGMLWSREDDEHVPVRGSCGSEGLGEKCSGEVQEHVSFVRNVLVSPPHAHGCEALGHFYLLVVCRRSKDIWRKMKEETGISRALPHTHRANVLTWFSSVSHLAV